MENAANKKIGIINRTVPFIVLSARLASKRERKIYEEG